VDVVTHRSGPPLTERPQANKVGVRQTARRDTLDRQDIATTEVDRGVAHGVADAGAKARPVGNDGTKARHVDPVLPWHEVGEGLALHSREQNKAVRSTAARQRVRARTAAQ